MHINSRNNSGRPNSEKEHHSSFRSKLPVVLLLMSGVTFWLAVTGYQSGFDAYTEQISGSDISIDMVPIPGGSFTMYPSGSIDNSPEGATREIESLHIQVDPFWMAQTEITWAQYELFADDLPSNIEGLSLQMNDGSEITADAIALPTQPYVEMSFGMGTVGYPAISMTHYAAVMYTRWLTLKTGQFYRLPTEAEWEYACRGGTETNRWYDETEPVANENTNPAQSTLDTYEWYLDNSNGTYNPVAVKEPNPYGLYDMMGNIAEWTTDHYYEDYVSQIQLAYSDLTTSRLESGGRVNSGESGSDDTEAGSIAEEVVVTFEGDTALNPWFPPTALYPRSVRGGSWMDSAESLGCGQRRGSQARWKQLDPQLPKSLWWHTSAPIVGFRVVRPLETPSMEEMEQYWVEAIEDY